MKISSLLSYILLAAVVGLGIFLPGIISFISDWWWFDEVGFGSIFRTAIFARLYIGFAVGILTALFLAANVVIASKTRSGWQATISEQLIGRAITLGQAAVYKLGIIASIVVGIMAGIIASVYWREILVFLNKVPFGAADPLFSRDISFYVFSLPVYSLLLSFAKFLITLALIACATAYFLQGGFNLATLLSGIFSRFGGTRRVVVDAGYGVFRKARLHLGVLLAFFFAAASVGTLFAAYELVIMNSGIVFGASATDAHIVLPLLRTSAIVFAAAALLMLLYAFTGKIGPLTIAVAVSIVISGVTAGVPPLYQRLVVAPNELAKETPFINNAIAATRSAYGLDKVEEREIDPSLSLQASDIVSNSATVKNVRLWDRAPLLSTFSQIQEIRTYYEFGSVDNDRYAIDGELRQIMLSPRELSPENLPNKTWINERLTFTHGYGVAAGPVNQVTPEGLPVLFVKDLPPKSEKTELRVARPEIYFGELANDYVIVKTKSREFDYPQGDENVFTEYSGKGGVSIGSFFRRLVYAIRFQSLKFLLSGDITAQSKILLHRNIIERVGRIAPFLSWDNDPYLVIADGRLVWILDAYTTTDRYPYSQPLVMRNERLNYVRNSVKATIDAYDGTVKLYVADPADPIIQTYARIFPSMFVQLADMPASLRLHTRYPEDIFTAQTTMYTTYHMGDPQIFYNKEDLWEVPSYALEGYGVAQPVNAQDTVQPTDRAGSMAPRHMIMKLPGEKREEYILMLPFTPRAKDNLSAWMVARSDGDMYGKLVVYRFPKDKLVFGPKQIIGRINQDAEISRQISLWDQRGSQVIQGPLLVIPIESSLVYVRALYLKAETGKIPELKRVIVAYENKIAMEETLEKGLEKIFGSGLGKKEPQPVSAEQETPTPKKETDTADLFKRAQQAYDAALRAQREGNWSEYGSQIKTLGEVLRRLAP
ncbi:UPF0182 family protein [Candidatus Uhrbacteria bacterium]|nr:UPF0182 family protein [Candidatus Uhrbacteria bacterium]